MQPRTEPYAGDKISFEPGDAAQLSKEGEPELQKKIGAALLELGNGKRTIKRLAEQNKEETAKQIESWAKGELDKLNVTVKPGAEREIARGAIEAEKIKRMKDMLVAYHERVAASGWRWRKVRRELETQFGERLRIEDLRTDPEGGWAFIRSASGAMLWTVYFGRSRFRIEPDDADRADANVYTKRGAPATPEQRDRNQFILDRNGVLTHRYVTRAITIFHVVQMFGLEIEPPAKVDDERDDTLRRYLRRETAKRLCRKADNVDKEPIVRPAFHDRGENKGKRLKEQLPRYLDDSFGGHADIFDIRYAASYEQDGLINPDFVPYRVRGTRERTIGKKTGLPIVTGYCESRQRSDPMMGNERASMQLRNGSGPYQSYLSAASTQDSSKVIRGNKGEAFDTGADNQATLRIDLSEARRLGVDIVNQHAEESNPFKIAYNRYYDKDDVAPLERRVAHRLIALASNRLQVEELKKKLESLASVERGPEAALTAPDPTAKAESLAEKPVTTEWEKVEDTILALLRAPEDGALEDLAGMLAGKGLWPWDLGIPSTSFDGLSYDAINKIMSLRGNTIDFTRERIKRPAAVELDDYIVSVRKNREVLIDRIPLSCVVEIQLNLENENKWPGLKLEKIETWRANKRSPWLKWTDVQQALTDYVTVDGNANIKTMFVTAAKAKREESGRD